MNRALPVNKAAAIRKECAALCALAWPMMIAQLAQCGTTLVDTLMAGRVSAIDLAAISLGSSIWFSIFIGLAGVLLGLSPLVAYDYGANNPSAIRQHFQAGLRLGVILSFVSIGLIFLALPLLPYTQAEVAVQEKTIAYLYAICWGLPGFLLYRVYYSLYSALGLNQPLMMSSLVGLLANIPLNAVFIYGQFGIPALGGVGCGWANSIVMWLSLAFMVWHSHRHPFIQSFQLYSHGTAQGRFQAIKSILKLGFPIGLTYCIEVSAFSVIALLLAHLGAVVVAGHQSVMSLSALIYMLPLSLSMALTARVGQALGANTPLAAQLSSQCGVGLALILATLTATFIFIGRYTLAEMYSPDPAVQALIVSILLYAVYYQWPDALQVCSAGALRGYQVTTLPMWIQMFSFWGIALPLGIFLGISEQGIAFGLTGAAGFWAALVMGLSIAGLFLTRLLFKIVRKTIENPA